MGLGNWFNRYILEVKAEEGVEPAKADDPPEVRAKSVELVPDFAKGCLQDIHWSMGLMGYFPTYCLGNLYAAQLWETINEQIPDLESKIARGEFAPLKEWLATNIHHHGRRYRAGELCERLTGKPLSADPLLRHLEGKLRPVYGLA